MVESAGKMNPRSTSHGGNLSNNNLHVNTELPKPDPRILLELQRIGETEVSSEVDRMKRSIRITNREEASEMRVTK
jgi:hypothetical protein